MASGAGGGKHPLGDSKSDGSIGDFPQTLGAVPTNGHPTTMDVTMSTMIGGGAVRARLSTSSVSSQPPPAGGGGGAMSMASSSGSSSSVGEATNRHGQDASGDEALALARRPICSDGGWPKVAVALKLCGILTLLAGYSVMFYSGNRLIGSLLAEDTTGVMTPLTVGILIGLPVALLPLSCLMVACGRCCDGDCLQQREGGWRRRRQRQQQQQHRRHYHDRLSQGRAVSRNRLGSGSAHIV